MFQIFVQRLDLDFKSRRVFLQISGVRIRIDHRNDAARLNVNLIEQLTVRIIFRTDQSQNGL